MNVKDAYSQTNKIALIVVGLLVVILSYILLSYSQSFSKRNTTTNLDDITSPTEVQGFGLTYKELLSGRESQIFENNDLKIYAITKSSKARVIYAYKEEPAGRALTDKFFLHLYLKDSTKLNRGARFVNVDFFQAPTPVTVQGDTYYVFNKELISSQYVGKEVPLSAIDHIRTGRNKPGADRSLDLGPIPIADILISELESDLDEITISITTEDYKKILEKREEALEIGVLSTGDDDLIKGQISMNGGLYKDIEVRLKGDWSDHLKDQKKWSYRVIMRQGETLKGMRKFSIQHPKVRNFLWEWLFNKVVKDEGIIGLRYDFAEINLQIDNDFDKRSRLGVMAVEESFDKILIEHNKKREGIIIAFDESVYWSDVKKQRKLKLDGNAYSKKLRDVASAPIRVFNENKVLSTPELNMQFEIARDLLDGLRQSKYKISQVFDMDKLTTFVALNNLFNGNHGLVWHNLRIYYNPITAKLEPVSFDSMAGRKLTKITHYPFAETDSIYQIQIRQKLRKISSSSYINDFIERHKDQLKKNRTALFTEYTGVFDPEVLEYNSNYIKKQLDPSLHISASLLNYDETSITVQVKNLTEYPVIVKNLLHTDGRILSDGQPEIVVEKDSLKEIRLKLNTYFVNAFVSKRNKKGVFQFPKDVSKLQIEHYIEGVGARRQTGIGTTSLRQNLESYTNRYIPSGKANYGEFTFINKTSDSVLTFLTGEYKLGKSLIIPAGYTVKIPSGFSLDLSNNAFIKSEAALICEGTADHPVKFYSSDGTGQGIFISDAINTSEIAYTHFDNLSNPQTEIWSVSGAVNFHESDVHISNSSFTSNRCEDALNIIRSEFKIVNSYFENTQSDAFDGDFVTGMLKNCTFVNSGNDAIDVSGSSLILEGIKVINPSDKGISAGENSAITGKNITISGGEIGVVSKDLSKVALADVRIKDTRLGLSAFQKKSEYGAASIDVYGLSLQNIEVDHLIEINSRLTIDNIPVKTVSNNVIDKMYGKEYGKSSR